VLDGLPAGVEVTSADLARDLGRRRLGYGRGARMTFEQDEVELTGGVRHGVTMGGPIAVRVGNSEWPKWETVMAADPVDPDLLAQQARNAPLTRPRPGHADLAGMQKYDLDDARPILERASARETAARVAAGGVAKLLLREFGMQVRSFTRSVGAIEAALPSLLTAEAAAILEGDSLVHLDVRSDNLCFRDGRALIVDWNWAALGDPAVDAQFWLPSLVLERGTPPVQLEPEYAAWLLGFFAARAGLPPIPDAPGVRLIQLAQLAVVLPWACRLLALPPPGG